MGNKIKSVVENSEFRRRLKKHLIFMEDSLETETLLNQGKQNIYVGLLFRRFKQLKDAQRELDKMFKDKYEFYMYRYQLDRDINPDGIVLDKSEVKVYSKADKEYLEVKRKVDILTIDVDYLQKVVKMFEDRNWSIKNKIEIMKFLQGER